MTSNPSAFDAAIDRIASHCIAVRMRQLNRVVTGIYDNALRPLGVKISQLNVLVAAAKLKIAQPHKVCQILELDASTLSRNLDRMKARGWTEVIPGDDARAQPFRLTPAGKRLVERALPLWERAQKQAGQKLAEEGLTPTLGHAPASKH